MENEQVDIKKSRNVVPFFGTSGIKAVIISGDKGKVTSDDFLNNLGVSKVYSSVIAKKLTDAGLLSFVGKEGRVKNYQITDKGKEVYDSIKSIQSKCNELF